MRPPQLKAAAVYGVNTFSQAGVLLDVNTSAAPSVLIQGANDGRATPARASATFGIMAVYLVGFIASLFGTDLRFWNEPSPLGIGISVIVVIVASLNLILDFDFIERGVNNQLPKQMEWFAAFGLVVTLVWLYLEMLRLLSFLQDDG